MFLVSSFPFSLLFPPAPAMLLTFYCTRKMKNYNHRSNLEVWYLKQALYGNTEDCFSPIRTAHKLLLDQFYICRRTLEATYVQNNLLLKKNCTRTRRGTITLTMSRKLPLSNIRWHQKIAAQPLVWNLKSYVIYYQII